MSYKRRKEEEEEEEEEKETIYLYMCIYKAIGGIEIYMDTR
jgi:hypothetical protein